MQRSVSPRAKNRCGYCGIHQVNTEFGCEVDHIISEKHNGRTELDNLAFACFFCNRNKGTDVCSIRSTDASVFVRFFNPRTDVWSDHFAYSLHRRIVPKTDVGLVTARIFGFNAENRLLERESFLEE